MTTLAASKRRPADPYDAAFTARFCRWCGLMLGGLFRWRVSGFEQFKTARPGIIAINHNAGCWGILDVVAVYCAFHGVCPPGRHVLRGMTTDRTFRLPVIGPVARRIGLRPPTPAELRQSITEGEWVLLAPGGDTDMRRPVWRRNRVRFKKAIFVGGRRVLRDNPWYAQIAIDLGVPVYPVAISGTHEMTPILYESPGVFRWSGLRRWRADEFWPGFSLTLNHVVNAGVFALTPLRSSLLAWVVFVVAHVYLEFLYFYPLFPFQVRLHACQPVFPGTLPTSADRHALQCRMNGEVASRIDDALDELERRRWWRRALTRLTAFVPEKTT